MTNVKLFDENAPFQVKGLHIAREIKNMQRLLLFFLQREKKKENLEIQTYIIRKRKWYKMEKNITEIGS